MDIAENRRLSRLIEIGYRIYRGEIGVPVQTAPTRKEPIQGWSEAAYREGLEREIAESFSARPGTLEYLIARVRDGSIRDFTEEDCGAAVSILNVLLRCALFTQSSLGDGPEAERELQSQVPGLPISLYSDLIGYYGYINR